MEKSIFGIYRVYAHTSDSKVPRLIRGPISLIQNSFANTPMQYR